MLDLTTIRPNGKVEQLRDGDPMTVDAKKMLTRLTQMREAIEAESKLAAESRQIVELDQQSVGRLSRMDAMQSQAMAEAQERKRQSDLVRIDLAQRRISEGDYGYCSDCGEEIAAKRLEIDPLAERCIGCA